MWNLRTALKVRLMHEGQEIEVVKLDSNHKAQALLQEARQQIKMDRAVSIENAQNLTAVEAKELGDIDGLDVAQLLAVQKWQIAEHYCVPIEQVGGDLVLWDNDGRRRGQITNLEELIQPDIAEHRDAQSFEKQAQWQQGLTPWDTSSAALRI